MAGLGVVLAATEAFICTSLGMVVQVFSNFCESDGHTLLFEHQLMRSILEINTKGKKNKLNCPYSPLHWYCNRGSYLLLGLCGVALNRLACHERFQGFLDGADLL